MQLRRADPSSASVFSTANAISTALLIFGFACLAAGHYLLHLLETDCVAGIDYDGLILRFSTISLVGTALVLGGCVNFCAHLAAEHSLWIGLVTLPCSVFLAVRGAECCNFNNASAITYFMTLTLAISVPLLFLCAPAYQNEESAELGTSSLPPHSDVVVHR